MDLSNHSIAAHFDEIANWLEIQGENAFRVRAYRNAADSIQQLTQSLHQMVKDGEDIDKIKGVGTAIADKTKELVGTGKIKFLEDLRAKYPSSLLALLGVPSLGAKKVGILFTELGVRDLDTLKLAAEQQRIRALKGFGEKTEQSILHGISIASSASERMRIDDASDLIAELSEYLANTPLITKFEFAGSFRRRRDTVGDIDILAVADDIPAAMKYFTKYKDVTEVLAQGETKTSVRLKNAFQADLRIVPADSWGAALQYFTGSQQHNIHVRQVAKDHGYKLNEYGLAPNSPELKTVDASNEESIYKFLGMPWISPEFRENRFEFEPDFAKDAKSIIDVKDIRGDLHMHTTATDGSESIETMAQACQDRGYDYIAITDHSKRVSMARGLTPERALEQWANIDEINASKQFKIRIFKGIECDILEDGTMDLPDEVLKQADWVLASVHYGQRQTKEQITERILNALKNPYVHAIAHPTGRLIGQREAYEVDIHAVINAAKEHGKALEINANPRRLDLNDTNARSAYLAGIPITINTDAHSIPNLDLMPYGIMQARRAGIPRKSVINTWTLKQFTQFSQMNR